MSPHTILYIDHCSELSGAQLSLLSLISGLDTSRFRPVVVLPADGPLASALAERGIPVRLVPMASSFLALSRGFAAAHPFRTAAMLRHAFGPVREVRRIIREERAAVVHSNSIKAHVLAAAALRGTGARLIGHVRDILGRGPAERALLWAARRWPDRVVAISEAVRDSIVGPDADLDSVVTIHNGIDIEPVPSADDTDALRRELGVAPDVPLVGLVGQIARWKGQHEFIEAAAAIAATHPEARFLIVGKVMFPENEAQYERDLLALVEQLDLEKTILFTGERRDVPRILAACDVMVHAAIEPEPFGRVLVEAMAAAKPVVATDTGASAEIVVGLNGPAAEPTGILVPPRDPDAIASAVVRLIGDRELARRLGAAGLERVRQHFTIDRTIKAVEQLYSEVTSSSDEER
ncbi:MAG: glycosyltransferase family 4 protein [Armatimonadota bacterium]